MPRFSLRLLLASLCLSCSSAFAAVTYHASDWGILSSVDNVMVNGVAYNVSFVDGTCHTVFAGCSTAAFTFHDAASAKSASMALMEQVFVDTGVPYRNYDTFMMINGCSDSIFCTAITPYDIVPFIAGPLVHASNANNSLKEIWDDVTDFPVEVACDLASGFSTGCQLGIWSSITRVYAVWTPVAVDVDPRDVPEPGSFALMGIAALGLAAARRRKRPAA